MRFGSLMEIPGGPVCLASAVRLAFPNEHDQVGKIFFPTLCVGYGCNGKYKYDVDQHWVSIAIFTAHLRKSEGARRDLPWDP